MSKVITIGLGSFVMDKVTTFQGVVTGHATYISGCDQFCVQPKCDDENLGTLPKSAWFDSSRLLVVDGPGVSLTRSDVEGR